MDLLICTYPLYLTHQYYGDQTDNTNLPFLAVWWSTFGAITLAENYANIDGFPFYWVIKSGVLISLYSSDYREWLTKNALSTVAVAGNKIKDGVVTIVDEHFPTVKKYIKLDKNTDSSDQNQNQNNRLSRGWFSGIYGLFGNKNE